MWGAVAVCMCNLECYTVQSVCAEVQVVENGTRFGWRSFARAYVIARNMTYQCHCQLEAKIVEHHDNYRRRYACCPKQDEHTCPYFEEVDPEYPNRAMEVIDELVAEMREAHDVLLEERNRQYWMEEEDRAVEGRMRVEVDEVKDVLSVALAAVMVLLAAVLACGVQYAVVLYSFELFQWNDI
ncbi:hypothetical protein Cgig2_017710 [Carnegiea gigantea]|uniref:Uncharacterized protein n=1 Tax=Carnegiea gigantea TaxID=171969 RepID=A0A9Q1K228_9CARY|nr:hypothetical protein Cgig2_017710 [Carnegiea gigantea]